MAEKPRELWQVPLHWLRDRGRIGEIGVKCNGCGHKHSWPIGEMMQEHGPRALVSDLWNRWRCPSCGSRNVVPFSIAQLRDRKRPS
jgi:rubredoxin